MPQRLRQIEELYHAARESSPDERARLLSAADPEIRREVESLLAQIGGTYLDRPAIHNITQAAPDSKSDRIASGAIFGPYRIESKLGEGGMGAVYRATDSRLDRAVAIKIAQPQFIERFGREARAISSLNHPHICTLYDIGPNYLVMEFVEGETIATRLKSGPFLQETALQYAEQILAALVEAHEKSLVHRDLKPGNIMIGKSGVKVLDFGLAKSDTDETVTASHMVMGTPAYMAPEQREGKPADARSDIYSFGCVLYEMLTGLRATSRRRRLASRKLERIVGRCLEEDSSKRWQSAAELARELSGATDNHSRKRDSTTTVTTLSAGRSSPNRSSGVADKRTVVVADFANSTGCSAFDSSLREILVVQLAHSLGLSVLTDPRAGRTLSQMCRPANTRLTTEIAAEICERTASAAVIDGSVTNLGSGFLLSLSARDCRTGDVLEQEQARVTKKEDVSKVLARIAKRFAARASESIPLVAREPSLSDESTTPSLEAWRCYSAAMKALQGRGAAAAETVSLLKRAVEIDPNFAVAYAHLGRQCDGTGESETGARYIAKAYELRSRVSDWENYFITFNYERQVTRNMERARQTLESWARKYPKDLFPCGFLAAFASQATGHYESAAQAAELAIAIDPEYSVGYGNGAFALLYANRIPEAEALLRRASERKIDTFNFSILRYFMAFLRNDDGAMERESTQRQAKFRAQGWYEHQESLTFAYKGRIKEAKQLSERAVNLARQGGFPERAAVFGGARAVWNAFYGNVSEARTYAAAALSLFRGRDADYGPALALSLIGDSADARAIQTDLEKLYPEDTSVQFSYLPTLRAVEALNKDDPASAVELTHAAASYELGIPATAFYTGAYFGALYPVYVRGLAYLRMGAAREAAAELQKFLHQPGLVLNDPIGPMARLQLARALSKSEDRVESTSVYKDLLTIWKDADLNISIVEQAKAESAQVS